ncbi:hypothetical protein HAX54_044119 [Datura stramonium]|uniref:Uncharacterized protein n=1 Tax=Datura stramonium TaxID=4076 RepID=A0ABS8W3U7_DATST|nr:hypothetical protein [Datura stramonium]
MGVVEPSASFSLPNDVDGLSEEKMALYQSSGSIAPPSMIHCPLLEVLCIGRHSCRDVWSSPITSETLVLCCLIRAQEKVFATEVSRGAGSDMPALLIECQHPAVLPARRQPAPEALSISS